jgi:anaerobic selenocysteine-containing dehydrogenase
VVITRRTWDDVRPCTSDRRIRLALPDLLAELTQLDVAERRDPELPFVLSAGERRSFTANTIIRDARWRKKGADGALRICPADASALGVSEGDAVRITTATGSAVVPIEVSDAMQPGHVSLPNGMGIAGASGSAAAGVAPNELTAAGDRDRFAGTPWHKYVPARIEAVRG